MAYAASLDSYTLEGNFPDRPKVCYHKTGNQEVYFNENANGIGILPPSSLLSMIPSLVPSHVHIALPLSMPSSVPSKEPRIDGTPTSRGDLASHYIMMDSNTNECALGFVHTTYYQCAMYDQSIGDDKFRDDTYYENYIITNGSNPKGCFLDSDANHIYYNEDPTGGSAPDTSLICIRK